MPHPAIPTRVADGVGFEFGGCCVARPVVAHACMLSSSPAAHDTASPTVVQCIHPKGDYGNMDDLDYEALSC